MINIFFVLNNLNYWTFLKTEVNTLWSYQCLLSITLKVLKIWNVVDKNGFILDFDLCENVYHFFHFLKKEQLLNRIQNLYDFSSQQCFRICFRLKFIRKFKFHIEISSLSYFNTIIFLKHFSILVISSYIFFFLFPWIIDGHCM